jgi:hypothetical protein
MSTDVAEDRRQVVRYALIVAGVALVASLTMVLVVFRMQQFVINLDDPYNYGEIARGLLQHGFTKLTRRSASLYPMFIALVYRLAALTSRSSCCSACSTPPRASWPLISGDGFTMHARVFWPECFVHCIRCCCAMWPTFTWRPT